jgi:hypothetical protein
LFAQQRSSGSVGCCSMSRQKSAHSRSFWIEITTSRPSAQLKAP